ncbi:MAG TPA: hypothetical protein VKX96_13845, partial [Chloroflexota bacterium]|nr:hypothetical protein [Chloroflexota bacterium]
TEIKDDLIESTQDAVVSFVQDQVEQRAWRSGSRLSTAELFSRYNVWCDQTKAFAGYRSQSHLVQGLKKLRALGWIEHHRTSDSRGWVLRSVPGQPEAATEEVEFITQPVVQFTKARALMERMKAQQQVH